MRVVSERGGGTVTAPAVDLLTRILADVPRLPGRAACRDHVGVFDRAADGDQSAAQEAAEICSACPVLAACGEWIATARRPPPGVWAGRFTPPPTSRKRKTA
jgi:hypothetical protein